MSRSGRKPPYCVADRRYKSIFVAEKIVEGFGVDFRELQKFNHIDAAFPGFALGQKRVRHVHLFRYVTLGQSGMLTGFDQAYQESVIGDLVGNRPRLSRFPSFRSLGPLHTNQCEDQLIVPLIRDTMGRTIATFRSVR